MTASLLRCSLHLVENVPPNTLPSVKWVKLTSLRSSGVELNSGSACLGNGVMGCEICLPCVMKLPANEN